MQSPKWRLTRPPTPVLKHLPATLKTELKALAKGKAGDVDKERETQHIAHVFPRPGLDLSIHNTRAVLIHNQIITEITEKVVNTQH
eukprot:scaffold190668_cov33-Prasinocladus_malaysianus.AAC.2